MSGPPPPLGTPWLANVGNNPNINRDPPPPPLDAVPGFQAVPPPFQQQVHVQHAAPPQVVVNGPPVVGVAGPILQPPLVGVGVGMPPPFLGGGFGGFGVHSAGPLGPPRMPWNTPGMLGNPYTAGMGAMGVGLPPPPPGIFGGMIPPFAPAAPLWAAGGGVMPGMGMGMGMGMGGYGMGMGMPGWHPPAPGAITEATAPSQPQQGDFTEVPGGCPPGATHVESAEYTIVHHLKGQVLPWMSHGIPMEVEILHLGSSTGINRLIQVCNNNNAECEGLAISECHEMVNGMWEKGQTFVFNDAPSRVLTVKDAGWDNTRNRPGGASLHIFLHRV